MTITELDFIGVPSTDSERSRAFYVETLGLRPDPNANEGGRHAWASPVLRRLPSGRSGGSPSAA